MHCAFAFLRVSVVVAGLVVCLVIHAAVWLAFYRDFGWGGSLLRRSTLEEATWLCGRDSWI